MLPGPPQKLRSASQAGSSSSTGTGVLSFRAGYLKKRILMPAACFRAWAVPGVDDVEVAGGELVGLACAQVAEQGPAADHVLVLARLGGGAGRRRRPPGRR